jgi:hypothetical protein
MPWYASLRRTSRRSHLKRRSGRRPPTPLLGQAQHGEPMSDNLDQEITAIRGVLTALEPLDAGIRANVLDYVLKRLGISAATITQPSTPGSPLPSSNVTPAGTTAVHIKAFKEQKNPKSANEMAAVVAYYMVNLAPLTERRETIKAKDIETQFKIADYPLRSRFVLANAKNAGYLDSVGDGEYRLNAVGHNLVVHNLPRKDGQKVTRPRRAKRSTGGSKVRRKK